MLLRYIRIVVLLLYVIIIISNINFCRLGPSKQYHCRSILYWLLKLFNQNSLVATETHMLTKPGWEENNTIGKWANGPRIKAAKPSNKNNILQPLRLIPNMFGYVWVEGGTTLLKKQTCSYTSNSSFQTGKKGFGRSSTPPKNPKEDDRGVSTPHFFGNLRDPDASSAMHGWEDPPIRWLWHQAAQIWGTVCSVNINLLLGSIRFKKKTW